jgi:hypothetical protein
MKKLRNIHPGEVLLEEFLKPLRKLPPSSRQFTSRVPGLLVRIDTGR